MVELGRTPEGRELEEYFAALLQSTGHYVEKNIHKPNILELDIVATNYLQQSSRPRLFEVKGTSAQLEDIFKLIGRMTYLGIEEGAFVTTKRPRDRDIAWFTGVCEATNVRFVMVPDLTKAQDTFEAAGFGRAAEVPHEIWRFSYWLERIFVQAIRQLRPTSITARAASDYYELMNSGIFLTPDHVEKARKIYEAYQEHPRLTGELADELAPDGRGAALKTQGLYGGRHVPLQATMYFEHRARISLLKAAADYLLAGGAVDVSDPDNVTVDFRIADLPQSFLRGLGWLRQQQSYWLHPLFWQNFLWAWGGILPDEHRDRVLSDIAKASGLTRKQGAVALQTFDELFPVADGWFRRFATADYEFVMLTPFQFQGLGVFHQLTAAGLRTYGEYVTTGQYTASDFAKRHNAAAKLIEQAANSAA